MRRTFGRATREPRKPVRPGPESRFDPPPPSPARSFALAFAFLVAVSAILGFGAEHFLSNTLSQVLR